MTAKPSDLGRIQEIFDVARQYGFDTKGASGVRNRLAHAYGEVDREILWQVIAEDFDALLGSCRAYCDDRGLELS